MSDIVTDDEASVTITSTVLESARDDTMHLPSRLMDGTRYVTMIQKVIKENLSPLETVLKILLLVRDSTQWVVDGRPIEDAEEPARWTPELLLEIINREIGGLKYIAKYGWEDPTLEDQGESVILPNWHDYLSIKELAREERRKAQSSSA
jgi:hypothetical protein